MPFCSRLDDSTKILPQVQTGLSPSGRRLIFWPQRPPYRRGFTQPQGFRKNCPMITQADQYFVSLIHQIYFRFCYNRNRENCHQHPHHLPADLR